MLMFVIREMRAGNRFAIVDEHGTILRELVIPEKLD
jgi:hypothetical protein